MKLCKNLLSYAAIASFKLRWINSVKLLSTKFPNQRDGVVVRAEVGKLRPAGRMRPSRAFCAAREHFLKLCQIEINTTGGLKRRKSDGQPRIYRLRKGDDLFFLKAPPFSRPEIPHCKDISRNFELMQFLLQQAAVRDNKPWPSTTRKMVDAALRLKSLPTPRLERPLRSR